MLRSFVKFCHSRLDHPRSEFKKMRRLSNTQFLRAFFLSLRASTSSSSAWLVIASTSTTSYPGEETDFVIPNYIWASFLESIELKMIGMRYEGWSLATPPGYGLASFLLIYLYYFQLVRCIVPCENFVISFCLAEARALGCKLWASNFFRGNCQAMSWKRFLPLKPRLEALR